MRARSSVVLRAPNSSLNVPASKYFPKGTPELISAMSSALSLELPAGFTAMTVGLSVELPASGRAVPPAFGGGTGRAAAKSMIGKAAVDGAGEIGGAAGLGSSLAGTGLAVFATAWVRAFSKPKDGTGAGDKAAAEVCGWDLGAAVWGEADVDARGAVSECGVAPKCSPKRISDSPIRCLYA